MNRHFRSCGRLLVVAAVALGSAFAKTEAMQSGPETVIVTYRPKAEQEAKLLEAISQQWAILRRLGAVEERPHLVFRSTENGGKPVLTEVLTWVEADDADHMPAEVQALWKQMQSVTEAREGRPGVDIHAVEPVNTANWK